MNGRIFAQALCSLRGKELRMLHVLCCDIGIVDILSSKLQDLLPGESNHFMQRLEEKVSAILDQPDEKLQLDILLEMAKRLELRGSHLLTDQEVEDCAGQIVEKAEQLLSEQDSRYPTYKEEHPGMDPLQSMVRFQMDLLLLQVGKEMDAASSEKQQEYVEKVQEFIRSMPNEKQEQIRERLGVEQLTNEVLQKIIVTSGASVLFAVIVEVSGFAFYTTATSLLASLAGLLGITLSFGTYTALTSAVAVLASPVFILLLLGGGGFFLYRSQNQKLRSKMLPILILQITLPAMSTPQEAVSYQPLQAIWQTARVQHQSLKDQLREHQQLSADCANKIAVCKEEIQDRQTKIAENDKKIEGKIAEVKTRLSRTALTRLQVSDRFTMLAFRYELIDQEIARKRGSQRVTEEGFFGWVSQKIQSVSIEIDIAGLQRKQAELLAELASEVLLGEQDWGKEERAFIEAARRENQIQREQVALLEQRRRELEAKQAFHRAEAAKLKKDIGGLEHRVYGLAHM